MSSILLDGQGLSDAYRAIKAFDEQSAKPDELDALINLVYSIILWDEAYILHEQFNSIQNKALYFFNNIGTDINLFRRIKLSSETEKQLFMHFFDNIPSEDITIDPATGYRSFRGKHHDKKRALAYLLAANEAGMDYLPSPNRALLLDEIDYQGFFRRKDVLEKLDYHLLRFYEQLNALIGRSSIHYQFPVMLDYILERSKKTEDIIKYAFDLKYDPAVIRFRKGLDSLNNAFNSGNLLEIRNYFDSIQGIVDDISESTRSKKSVDITISFPPSLTFSLNVPSKRPNHLLFIRTLANYGINNRRPYRNL